jgi:hypothetical protein
MMLWSVMHEIDARTRCNRARTPLGTWSEAQPTVDEQTTIHFTPDTPSPGLHPPPFLFDTAIFDPSYYTRTKSYCYNPFNHAVRQRVVNNKRNQACDTSIRHYLTQQHTNLTTTHYNLTLLHIQQWRSERPRPTSPSSGIDCPTCTKFSVGRPNRPSICSASTSTCAMPNAASTISISGTHSLHRLAEYTHQN